MINTKDLRDIFDEATKRAGDAIGDAKMPSVSIGRSDPTPRFAYFAAGLLLGAVVGLVLAFLATPVKGEEARQRLGEQVNKVRRAREEAANGSTYASPTTGAYVPPAGA